MNSNSNPLANHGTSIFLTDGGIETSLIYDDGIDLPYFAAFDLLKDDEGRAALQRYYRRYLTIAKERRTGYVLESPTWRASPDWAGKLGYDAAQLADANRRAIALMQDLRHEFESSSTPIVVSGCIGPRGDGYDPGTVMSAAEAEHYHARQIGTFAAAGVDVITAITMTNANEAIGVARAARASGLPVVISFTVETDGRLPTGQRLGDAIEEVDATTDGAPAYYMINCAHPSHFADVLEAGAPWVSRIGGVRANASRCSHAELNEMTELDSGVPGELAYLYLALRERLPGLRILGGCCGTNHQHIAEIAETCL